MDLGLRDCTGVRDFRACFGRVRCGLGALGPTRGSRSGSGRWVRSGREERRPPRRDAKGALSWAGAGDGLSSVSVASPTWALYLYGVNVLHREVRSGDATASPTGGPGNIVRGILRMNEVCPVCVGDWQCPTVSDKETVMGNSSLRQKRAAIRIVQEFLVRRTQPCQRNKCPWRSPSTISPT